MIAVTGETGRSNRDLTQMAVRKIFGRYQREERPSNILTPQPVAKDQSMEQLRKLWVDTQIIDAGTNYDMYETHLHLAVANSPKKFSAKEIEYFSLVLVEFQYEKNFNWKAGCFLNVLVAESMDTDFVIHTAHLTTLIDGLGKGNVCKSITIKGDVGGYTGKGMKGGKIVVDGNTHGYTGIQLSGGEIIVNGGAGEVIGWEMSGGFIHILGSVTINPGMDMTGGKIIIEGNADIFVGREMKSGELIILGNVGHFAGEDMEGGAIRIGKGTGQVIGRNMQGGEIHINDLDMKNISEYVVNGKIFSKGVLVFEK